MRSISFAIVTLVILLSSCGKWDNQNSQAQQPSPYPSIPMEQAMWSGWEKSLLSPPETQTTDSFVVKWVEPFWSVEIEKNTATLSRPGTGSTTTTNFSVSQDDKWALISIRWVKWDFFLTLVKGKCSDWASDMAYTFNATLNVWAEELHGCANRK